MFELVGKKILHFWCSDFFSCCARIDHENYTNFHYYFSLTNTEKRHANKTSQKRQALSQINDRKAAIVKKSFVVLVDDTTHLEIVIQEL